MQSYIHASIDVFSATAELILLLATISAGESIKQTANAAYEGVANAAKTVTGGRKDDKTTGPTGAAYRDRAG